MTCPGCGSYVAPSVRFCSNCGSPASDPEATRIARLQSRDLERASDDGMEHVIFTVRPTLIFVKAGYAIAVILGNWTCFSARVAERSRLHLYTNRTCAVTDSG